MNMQFVEDPSRPLVKLCAEHEIDVEAEAFAATESYLALGSCSSLVLGHTAKDEVVIKVWRGASMTTASRKKFSQRLSKELDVWKRLSVHPNIAPFIGVTSGFGHLPALIIPRYVEGNINDYLAKTPNADILHLLSGVAGALHFMHTQTPPLAHGKVRGSNILIAASGDACLSDIGISNMPYPYDLGMTGNTLDESRWMAPEVMDPEPTTVWDPEQTYTSAASDVYSFGMTILEVYTQRVPFSHRRFIAGVIHDVVNAIRPPRPTQHSGITDDIWSLIESCWKHNARERPDMGTVLAWIHVLFQLRQADKLTAFR